MELRARKARFRDLPVALWTERRVPDLEAGNPSLPRDAGTVGPRLGRSHPAVTDDLAVALGHEHLARVSGDVGGELLATVAGLDPQDACGSATAEATFSIVSGSIRTVPSGLPPASFGGRRRAIASIAWVMTPFSHTAQCMDETGGQRHGNQPAAGASVSHY
jgi:hypothetical protein